MGVVAAAAKAGEVRRRAASKDVTASKMSEAPRVGGKRSQPDSGSLMLIPPPKVISIEPTAEEKANAGKKQFLLPDKVMRGGQRLRLLSTTGAATTPTTRRTTASLGV